MCYELCCREYKTKWPQEPGAWVLHRLREATGPVSPEGLHLGIYCTKQLLIWRQSWDFILCKSRRM